MTTLSPFRSKRDTPPSTTNMHAILFTRLHYYISSILKQLRHRPRPIPLFLTLLILPLLLLVGYTLVPSTLFPNLLHGIPVPLTSPATLPVPSPPPETTCYHNPSEGPQETVCVHHPLCLSRSHQPYVHPLTTTQCLSVSNHTPPQNHSISCSELLLNLSFSLPQTTAISSPVLREWPFRVFYQGYASQIPGTTLFIAIDPQDTHIAKAAMRYFLAYSVIKNPSTYGLTKPVNNVIVVVPKWQADLYRGNGWVGGALRKILRDVGGVKNVVVVGGKSRMFHELVDAGILGDWTRRKSAVCFESVVRIGALANRFSIPDEEKEMKNQSILAAPLSSEAVSFHNDAFDYGPRRGKIIYVRRSIEENGRRFLYDDVEKGLLEALERAAGFTGAKVQVLEDGGAGKLLSFVQQISMVRDADVVIGIHGAGLTNAMFAPPSATLVELMPYQYNSRLYRSVENSGMRYTKIKIATGQEYRDIKKFKSRKFCMADEKCQQFYRDQDIMLIDTDIFRIEKAVIRGVLRSQKKHAQDF